MSQHSKDWWDGFMVAMLIGATILLLTVAFGV